MRMVFRVILPLLVVLGGIALGAMPVVDHLIQGWLRTDLETRSRLVFYAGQDALSGLVTATKSMLCSIASLVTARSWQDQSANGSGIRR